MRTNVLFWWPGDKSSLTSAKPVRLAEEQACSWPEASAGAQDASIPGGMTQDCSVTASGKGSGRSVMRSSKHGTHCPAAPQELKPKAQFPSCLPALQRWQSRKGGSEPQALPCEHLTTRHSCTPRLLPSCGSWQNQPSSWCSTQLGTTTSGLSCPYQGAGSAPWAVHPQTQVPLPT